MSGFNAVRNLASKVARRLQAAPKPLVRAMRRHARAGEHRAFQRDAEDIERAIATLARGRHPIIIGPWLAEVGYEVLYWIPFLRWFQDAYGVSRDRLIVVSRGGIDAAYGPLAGRYVDIFDLITDRDLAERNRQRRVAEEGGGQKQSASSTLDEELIAMVRSRLGLSHAAVCHPSLMFRLFRNVWHGNLPMDLLWRRTRYQLSTLPERPTHWESLVTTMIPGDFIAVKVYHGPALAMSDATRDAVRALVTQAASIAPVVLLDADLGLDEHRDFDLHGIAGVISARALMTPRNNLDVQLALIANARCFLSACGGLAWYAPFIGVPTVAIYDNDRLLAPHLFVARQAGSSTGAAEFMTLDLRGLTRLDIANTITRLGVSGRTSDYGNPPSPDPKGQALPVPNAQ